jgi:hypothetical protein
VAGLLDYGVVHQVNTLCFDPASLKLSIGLITVFTRPAWGWFLGRLGRIAWTVTTKRGANDVNQRLPPLLEREVPQVIFVDEGVRLRPNSLVWRKQGIQLVVSAEIWRGKPPKEWMCDTHILNHADLGGVTNGSFQVYLAKHALGQLNISVNVRNSPLAKFKNCLDGSIQGSRCAIPKEKVAPLGQDESGLLLWERWGYMVEAPKVYSK